MLKYVGYSVLVTMDTYLAFFLLAYTNKIMQNNVFRCDLLTQVITLVSVLTIPFPYPLGTHRVFSVWRIPNIRLLQELLKPFAQHPKLSVFPVA